MKNLVNLSIFNSKKIYIKCICFLIVLFLLNHWIGSELKSMEIKNTYSEMKWNEFYQLPSDSLDLIYLGSSHAYRSFDPRLLMETTNLKAFNMGSPLQKPVESYYVLNEVLQYQKPKYVVMDIYWGVFTNENYFNSKTWNYDCMRNSLNKLGYLLNVFDKGQYLEAVFYSFRYHESFDKYLYYWLGRYNPPTADKNYNELYKGCGFVLNEEQTTTESIKEPFIGAVESNIPFEWSSKQLYYLEKIVNLCKDENVNLILVTTPIAPTRLEMIDKYWYKYDVIHEFAQKIAHEYNLLYRDYNIINLQQNIVEDTDFSDCNHLNYKGVKKVNTDFIKWFKENNL